MSLRTGFETWAYARRSSRRHATWSIPIGPLLITTGIRAYVFNFRGRLKARSQSIEGAGQTFGSPR